MPRPGSLAAGRAGLGAKANALTAVSRRTPRGGRGCELKRSRLNSGYANATAAAKSSTLARWLRRSEGSGPDSSRSLATKRPAMSTTDCLRPSIADMRIGSNRQPKLGEPIGYWRRPQRNGKPSRQPQPKMWDRPNLGFGAEPLRDDHRRRRKSIAASRAATSSAPDRER